MEYKNIYLPNGPIFELVTTMFSWYASTDDCDTEEDVFEHSGDGGDDDGEESLVIWSQCVTVLWNIKIFDKQMQ